MLDEGYAGKTALTIRMAADEWKPICDPTIEDTYICMIDIDGRQIQLDTIDTAAQEQSARARLLGH